MDLDVATDIDSLPAQVASVYVHRHYPYETWLDFDEAIFDALWQDGADIGNHDLLVDLAASVGVDAEEVADALSDETLHAEVREQFTDAQQAGVSGVPTFVSDGYAARGAVPPAQLRRLVEGV
jgi:predicted DsbA family dithiol-disulfide isomerase